MSQETQSLEEAIHIVNSGNTTANLNYFLNTSGINTTRDWTWQPSNTERIRYYYTDAGQVNNTNGKSITMDSFPKYIISSDYFEVEITSIEQAEKMLAKIEEFYEKRRNNFKKVRI